MSATGARSSDVGSQYRIEHPGVRDMLADLRIPSSDPGPGRRIPVFTLPTTDGGTFAADQFDGTGQPVMLVFGSLTCPVTESAGPGLSALSRRYGDRVRFVMVNVREAHPGASAPQTADPRRKASRAAELRLHHGFDFEVAVDDVDGSLHRWFGTRPSPAYLIDPWGTIVFRAQWSNVTEELDAALAAVVAGRPVPRPAVSALVRSTLRMLGHAPAALRRGGRGARRDLWKGAFPLALVIGVAGRLTVVPARRRGVLAVGVLLAATVTLLGLVAG